MIWRFTDARAGSDAAERRAQQFIAALALYLVLDGVRIVVTGAHPDASWPGAVVAAAAVILMPRLSLEKRRVAAQLGSAATAGDTAQSKLCAIATAGVLASILANAALGWWWLDPPRPASRSPDSLSTRAAKPGSEKSAAPAPRSALRHQEPQPRATTTTTRDSADPKGRSWRTPLNIAAALTAALGAVLAAAGHAQHPAQVVVTLAASCAFLALLTRRVRATRSDWFTVRLLLAGNLVLYGITDEHQLGAVLELPAILSGLALLVVAVWARLLPHGQRRPKR